MKTYTDLDAFQDVVVARRLVVILPAGIAGFAVAYNYRGDAVARCFVHCC